MYKKLFLTLISISSLLLFSLLANALEVKIDGNNIKVRTNNDTSDKENDSVSVTIDSNSDITVDKNSSSKSSVSIGTVESSDNSGKNITKITNLHNVTIIHDGEKEVKILPKDEQR